MKRIISTFILLIGLVQVLHTQNRSDSVHVAHYDIHLSVLDFTGKTIEGYTALDVVSKIDGLQTFTLDLASFTVDSVFVANSHVPYRHANSLLVINSQNALQEGDTVNVKIFYRGQPETDPRWGGFYFSGQYAFNMGVGMSRIPHNYGRCWYPCIDDFTDKSTYHYHIRTENHKMAVCSGLLADTTHYEDGTINWEWKLQQPVPTYISSVAVGEYRIYTDTFHGMNDAVPIHIYTTPGNIDKVPGSFVHLKEALQNYESFFGPYRFDRVGYVGVHFNMGAMEHATNIAYPVSAVTGDLNYESLWIHELAHSWFGNLVTCERAEEMWLNEGFARYCESLMNEFLYPDPAPGNDPALIRRKLHRDVLTNSHLQDGGYFALDEVPQEVTYGSTSYDKGGIVVHTLRNYLGDTLFFSGIRQLMDEYSFKTINSPEFFEAMTTYTGVPLRDFYEAWIHQPGFLHFSIDSIRESGGPDHYRVYLKQKLSHATHYGNSNKVDLTFFSSDGNTFTYPGFIFSGLTGVTDIRIPFRPVYGVVDYDEKLADAVIDYNPELTSSEILTLSDAYLRVAPQQLPVPVKLRIEYNLVAPDPLKRDDPAIYKMADSYYWRIEYIAPETFDVHLHFRYSAALAHQKDYELLQGYTVEDLVLLYRRDAADDWRIIPFTQTGSSMSGYLRTTYIVPGEYTLGIGNKETGINHHHNKEKVNLQPNPARNYLEYHLGNLEREINKAEIFDTLGRVIKEIRIHTNSGIIDINTLSKGNYIIRFSDGKKSFTRKFVKE